VWCVVGGCYTLISVVLIHQCLQGLLVSAPSLLCEGRGFEPPLGRGKTTICHRDKASFYRFPSQLEAHSTMSMVILRPTTACRKDAGSSCGCQPKRRSRLLDGSPKSHFTSQRADLAVSQTQGLLDALVDKFVVLMTA
jgi:hypothetical protein